MKRLLSFAIVLAMLLTLAIPAMAVKTAPAKVDGNGAIVTASVDKLKGNKNQLNITITPANGSLIMESFKIGKNAAGIYILGDYKVYVDTKGNTKIHDCYFVAVPTSTLPSQVAAVTVNFPGVKGVSIQYWVNDVWTTYPGTFDDTATIFIPVGTTSVRAVKGGMSYTFDGVSLKNSARIFNVPVKKIDIIDVWANCNIGAIGNNWVYDSAPAKVGTDVLNSYNVFDNKLINYSVRVSKPGFNNIDFPALSYTDDSGNMYVHLAEACFYSITVPTGFTNVRMQSNNWIVNPANAGDTIEMLLTGKTGTMSFTYNNKTYTNVLFNLDGSDPFKSYAVEDAE